MYDDMKNYYHYKYEKDGNQPGQRYDSRTVEPQSYYRSSAQPEQPFVQEKSVKVKKKRTGLKIAALALACVLLGGAVGALLGMKLFRHKTRRWYFWAVALLGLALQALLLIGCIRRF